MPASAPLRNALMFDSPLMQTARALDDAMTIGIATGMLMATFGVGVPTAERVLTRMAKRDNTTLATTAAAYVTTAFD
jgi:hypothetical protein